MLTGSKRPSSKENDFRGIVLPGEIVFTSGANLITGHGTYRLDEMGGVTDTLVTSSNMDQSEHPTEETTTLPMHASLAGRMKSVNKLVYVEPPNTRYSGNVGDTVVGRIVEVHLNIIYFLMCFYLLAMINQILPIEFRSLVQFFYLSCNRNVYSVCLIIFESSFRMHTCC